MKKHTRQERKLVLQKDVVRVLDRSQLEEVGGGTGGRPKSVPIIDRD